MLGRVLLRFEYRPFIARHHATKAQAKNLPTSKALQHFDDYYSSVYGKSWSSLRLGLLCKPKKVALLNGFSVEEETGEELVSLGAENMRDVIECSEETDLKKSLRKGAHFKPYSPQIEEDLEVSPENRFALEHFMPVSKLKYQEAVISESEYYSFYHKSNEMLGYSKEDKFDFPLCWKAYSFPRGNITNFPNPIKDNIGIFPYKIIDGAALLPIMAMDIKAGDEVADLCAGPGDKSVAILLTMAPKSLLLNDITGSNVRMTKKAVQDYLPDFFLNHISIEYSQMDVCSLRPEKEFDKILLDVPCIGDRRSANIEENNFFSGSMMKKRNHLPGQLSNMLTSALSMLKEGGSLVYTTSTLSPVLNDGVVQAALFEATKENKKFVINDLRQCVVNCLVYFKMDLTFKYGVLVLPFLPNNFGPTYFSKITRIS